MYKTTAWPLFRLLMFILLFCWGMTLKCQSFMALDFESNTFKVHEISGVNPWLSSSVTTNLTGDLDNQIAFGANITQEIDLDFMQVPIGIGYVNDKIEFSALPYVLINKTEVDMAVLHGGVKAYFNADRTFEGADYYAQVEYLRKLKNERSITFSVGPYWSDEVIRFNVTSVIPLNNNIGVLIDYKHPNLLNAGILLAKQF